MNKTTILTGLLGLALILGLPLAAVSQGDIVEPEVPVQISSAPDVAPIGGAFVFTATFHVPPDHHITDKSYGLLYLELTLPAGWTTGDTLWPEGEKEAGEEVYRGKVPLGLEVNVPASAAPGEYTIPYSYSYQQCRELDPELCFPPNFGDGEVFINAEEGVATGSTAGGGAALEDRLTNALESGSIMAFLLVFLAGVLVSLTPCVYPMIPIIIGFVGSGAGGSKLKGFILSVFFVLGLVLSYATLGVIAGATGALFGAFMSNPIVLWVIVAIFVALGASMLGAFDIALPASVQGKLMGSQKQGIFGAIVMGGVTGLVAAPCAGPPLLVLLGWIGNTNSLVLGFFLMATFALGIGVLFIIIGTFAGAMTALPQAGPWMDNIKKGLGVVIFAVAVYYLNLLLPATLFTLVLGVFLILVGGAFGAFARWEERGMLGKIGKGVGVGLVAGGVFYVVLGLGRWNDVPLITGEGLSASGGDAAVEQVAEGKHVPFRVNDHDAVLMEAAETGKPVLIDFYADWCAVCVELDHNVWNQGEVIEAARAYIPLKLDYTRSSQALEDLRTRYKVGGLPTVLILGPDGTERARFSSYKSPEEAVAWLNRHK